MPYNIKIQNEQHEPLDGILYLWSDGGKVGEFDIPTAGTSISDEVVSQADHFTVEAPGYHFYGTSNLYDENMFTLARKPSYVIYIGLGLLGGFVLTKLLKFKL